MWVPACVFKPFWKTEENRGLFGSVLYLSPVACILVLIIIVVFGAPELEVALRGSIEPSVRLLGPSQ